MNVLDISYDVSDSPVLGAFLSSSCRRRLVIGPVGSGKSSGCIMELVLRGREMPLGNLEVDDLGRPRRVRRSRFAVVRNTYRELEDTTRKTFESWIPQPLQNWRENDFACVMRWTERAGTDRHPRIEVEVEVLFRALDQPKDVKKLLSLELTGAYLNELKEIPKGVWEMLDTRIGRYPAIKDLPEGSPEPWCGIFADTNPPDTDHWIYKLFEEDKPEGHELYHQPSGLSSNAENRRHLRATYYEDITAGKDADWVNVYVKSQYGFVKEGKPIYPEYNDSIHCSEAAEYMPHKEIIIGMDFGLTPAAALLQRDPSDGQLRAFFELVGDGIGATNFAIELARILKKDYPTSPVTGWGDPAGEQRSQVDERTPFDVVQGAGLPIHAAPTNDFTLRREAQALAFQRLTFRGRPGFVVHPRCRVLRKAYQGGYCYRRVQVAGMEKYEDKPFKNRYSHVAEGAQYALVGMGEDRRAVQGGRDWQGEVDVQPAERAVED